jgi:hypothetical protein
MAMRTIILARIALVLLGMNAVCYFCGADWGINEPQHNSSQDKDSACPGEGTGPDSHSFTVKVIRGSETFGAESNVVGPIGMWGQNVPAATYPFPTMGGACSFVLYHLGDPKATHTITFI